MTDHASKVLYPAINAAMQELATLPEPFCMEANKAFNILHAAFWSECPAPSSALPLRSEVPAIEPGIEPEQTP